METKRKVGEETEKVKDEGTERRERERNTRQCSR